VTSFLLAVLAAESFPLPAGTRADRLVVVKHERTLTLMSGPTVLKSYKVSLGSEPVGAKQRRGDHKTPEGTYILDRRNSRSRFYRSLHVSYPTLEQKAAASKTGIDPGGDIMIHGLPNGFGWLGSLHRTLDWTDGCIAVTDQEMDEIWQSVDDGTPIEIKP